MCTVSDAVGFNFVTSYHDPHHDKEQKHVHMNWVKKSLDLLRIMFLELSRYIFHVLKCIK